MGGWRKIHRMVGEVKTRTGSCILQSVQQRLQGWPWWTEWRDKAYEHSPAPKYFEVAEFDTVCQKLLHQFKTRPRWGCDTCWGTICALLTTKVNNIQHCNLVKPSKELLQSAKKACLSYNKDCVSQWWLISVLLFVSWLWLKLLFYVFLPEF